MQTKWIFKIDYSKSQSQARKFHSIFLIHSYMYKESPATRSYYISHNKINNLQEHVHNTETFCESRTW